MDFDAAPPQGSIPAWAGETGLGRGPGGTDLVYPRVGGGNHNTPPLHIHLRGLSPRGRGKLFDPLINKDYLRSIPAWAGETLPWYALPPPIPVYPRVGGGNSSPFLTAAFIAGLSPRGRGKPPSILTVPHRRRSIPAWAGETTPLTAAVYPHRVYPRVGGGNRRLVGLRSGSQGLSPRGRGKHTAKGGFMLILRSIPAWAGETRASPGPMS